MSRDNDATRRGIDEAAKRWRESSEQRGRPISQEQARRRVVEAIQITDRRQQGG